MSDSKTLPPEFAATAGDLMAYRARERFNLFELACLLHRADPEKVSDDTRNGWRDHKLQIGYDRAELTPALFIHELDLIPELLAGPLVGGTIKLLKKATGCATIWNSIEATKARTLADSLGLAFPAELMPTLRQRPAPQAEAPAVGVSGGGAVPAPDPERRLARLRALGGNATFSNRRGEWKFTGIKVLVAAEKAEGRKRRDEKTIRADLREAAEAEREAKRAGHWDRLGG